MMINTPEKCDECKMSRGRTAYSAIKQMFNIKGSRQKVLDIFNEIIEVQQKGEINE